MAYKSLLEEENEISCIISDKLYLTNFFGASNLEGLKKLNITHIINVTDTINNLYENEFKYLKIAIPDAFHITITDYFLDAFKFIDNALSANGRVMVHCMAGKSRSAAIVIGYIMNKEKKTFHEAMKYVQDIRQCIDPNLSFCGQLIIYQKTLDYSTRIS
jgi:protein-tyrosine phosphatase